MFQIKYIEKNTLLVLVSTALLFSFFNNSIAQITINGTVSDPNLSPISNALVEIFDQSDTLKNYTATTDASGYFSNFKHYRY